ncbi:MULTISPECIES: hypothetical protein [unclassified Mesorhizobium]|uniref:hypothetical protein n=1 Tax=unclassified Mesorhizobium TaxID=325217 RepID=UPI000FCC13AC|nr:MULTISPECIES: hypothetical protein [unclassified Mesorhizobium]RUW01103.1 hypothetical protein EOA49_12360 [Mesorhizobium sp. M1A.F.Ca.IN.020.04.1.1]RUW09396.1 hypothetical protein EOA53_16730 [Mesorhizobium sp. M1A.F.Ca.IN.020.03.1.1]RWF75493.1 MAG: hypothetical protein EOQ34_01650 [Mesorhizobium sp.]RWG16721.1 MAG: hypothetical protein EOQ58_07320 [Mesorhizobium sp.]RWG33438.1 MAG: hypothetical protein EOQ61_08340 [Mesorhizobium sp.]
MYAYFDRKLDDEAQRLGRYHPWDVQVSNERNHYSDFKGMPRDEVARHLEDIGKGGLIAREASLDFLVWANSDGVPFETNDFGMKPIKRNKQSQSTKGLQLTGRVTIFFRDLKANVPERRLLGFGHVLENELKQIDPGWQDACWGWNLWPHGFVALKKPGSPPNAPPNGDALGDVICLNIWAWGDSHKEIGRAYKRAYENLRAGLEAAASKYRLP